MRATFFGAAGEVTGSCTYLDTGRARILVDFGMHQGDRWAEARNRRLPPIDFGRLDAVVLTHAHIDHIGRLPLLVTAGYQGPIFATPATCELVTIMLRDSARLQVAEAQRDARRAARRGDDQDVEPPLYTEAEVERVLPLLRPVPYDQHHEVADAVTVRWVDAGHIVGSASLDVTLRGNSHVTRIAFSGDLGPRGRPLLKDPTPIVGADLTVLESTYGDRDHKDLATTEEEFAGIVREAVWARQFVIIPAFAVGRTQQILYHLGTLTRSGRVPRFPIFVDSPMAAAAINLCRKHAGDYDAEARALLTQGHDPLLLPDLRVIESSQESQALNHFDGAAVVIAASGMCTGGRIMFHLKHHLWKRDTHVVIAGYQARGSLGRRLVEGAKNVRIFGDPVIVRARVHTLGGLSAHAGRSELLEWGSAALDGAKSRERLPRLVLNHGEDAARASLAAGLKETRGSNAFLPAWGASVDL